MNRWIVLPSLALLAACSGAPDPSSSSQPADQESSAAEVASTDDALRTAPSRVFVLGNEAAGNHVLVFERQRDGTLEGAGKVATGGLGTDAGLGSQGALALSTDGAWLFAVNAGSNDVSLFRVSGRSLTLFDVVPSGGTRPISVTESHGVVYVLNAGDEAGIRGFRVERGQLRPIADSARSLGAGAAGPAQIQFSPDGNALVVTEKGSNSIDGFVVRRDGTPSEAHPVASSGTTPFGFAFDGRGTLVVSDAFGGAAGAGAVSSYRLDASSGAHVVSASVADGESAPCWVGVTPDGRYAYTTNAASNTVSGYALSADGSLALLPGTAAPTGAASHPTDLAAAPGGRFLYVLTAGSGHVTSFRIDDDGALQRLGDVDGAPASAVGLAVR